MSLDTDAIRALWQPTAGRFEESRIARLPEPVRRMLRASIAPGAPLATTAVVEMRGRIRLGRWIPFRATEVINPHTGFVWSARAGGIRGYDRYLRGAGEMRWKLLGAIPVMSASGPDVTRSAAGRAAAEGMWVPTAMLPDAGVEWSAVDERTLTATTRLDTYAVDLRITLDGSDRVVCCAFDRWGDPDRTGVHGPHRFAMEATGHRTFQGVTVPSTGRAGWHHGTDRFEEGVFFEYELTGLRLLADPPQGA